MENKKNIVNIDNKTLTKETELTVGILPYNFDNGMLTRVGVIKMENEVRLDKFYTLLTSQIQVSDKTITGTAKRLINENMKEEPENENIVFLGSLYLDSNSDKQIHVIGVDVSENKLKEDSKIKMIDSGNAILTNESIFLASYLRLFDYFYQTKIKTK